LVQPGEGVAPLVKGIGGAKSSVEIVIFRFDCGEIEKALAAAISRGVTVSALIAHTNRAGEDRLRKLELRLLAAGVTVARTADDLIRYHGKMMIVDRRELYVLGFNFTRLDIDRSRSFGLVTRNRKLVQEASKLFAADSKRFLYEPGAPDFVVSPANARRQLAQFIRSAKRQLLIYDLKVSDPEMVRLLEDRAHAGVDVRILGQKTRRNAGLPVRVPQQLRLHSRAIVRDGRHAFLGSQSLRQIELDRRREVGVIFRDPKSVGSLLRVFEEDWERAGKPAAEVKNAGPPAPDASVEKVAGRVAKAVAKNLPPVAPVLEEAIQEAAVPAGIKVDADEVQDSVKDAVKQAVKEVVADAVEVAVLDEPRVMRKTG
jgi:phosphatidylserine/phosphatidylglycerophosphate/cardiolipin synthase-like enzyme